MTALEYTHSKYSLAIVRRVMEEERLGRVSIAHNLAIVSIAHGAIVSIAHGG